MTDDDVIERNIGAFAAGADPTMLLPIWTTCCVGNCSCALYYVWESIVRQHNSVAQVNLLLNRASPCVDVDSYLPYEGKVVLKNKTAKKLRVRVPTWVDKKSVTCHLNGNNLKTDWLGHYLLFDNLSPRDQVTVKFPMVETTERWTEPTYQTTYTCRFKGNTLIDISPRAERPAWKTAIQDDGVEAKIAGGYPIYLNREGFAQNTTPMKKVTRFASTVVI